MFLRIDTLHVALPAPRRQDPNAAALQEWPGGKSGGMATLGNCLFHSFNFRGKSKLRPSRLHAFRPDDRAKMRGIWGGGETAPPDGGKIHAVTGTPSAFLPDCAPEDMLEIATRDYQTSR